MWWALWFLVFCDSSVMKFSHSLDSAVDFDDERYDDNSIQNYDYDYEDLLNYLLIYPGTKWCGRGDIAANDNDLGSFSETDMCCRAHDMCPDIIEAGQTRWGLENKAPYTRLSCTCDEDFLRCLKNSKDKKVSNVVGTLYFDLLNTKCFKLEHKVTGCKEFSSLGTRCLKYELDQTSEKVYQWFDVQPYNKK